MEAGVLTREGLRGLPTLLRTLVLAFHTFVVGVGYFVLSIPVVLAVQDLVVTAGLERPPASVRALACDTNALAVVAPPEAARDFDGDGVPDRLSASRVVRHRVFAKTTNLEVRVVSGASGERLFSLSTRWNLAGWCGDVDGNGTEDILLRSGDERRVHGHVGDE